MNDYKMDIIFHATPPPSLSIQDWLTHIKVDTPFLSYHQDMKNVALPVMRLGCTGILSDNPPIDRVEEILSQLEQCSMQLGLISLPVPSTVSEPKQGEEISCINGWIDTAGYAGCSHIRLCAPENETVHEAMRTLFREVCVYALDLYFQITFCGFSSQFVQSVRIGLNATQQSLIGTELQLDNMDSINIPDSVEDVPVSLVSFKWQSGMDEARIKSQLQSINQPILVQL